jgi:hypothetical protein
MADEDTDLEMSDREILTSTVDLQQGHHHISAKEYVKIHIKSIVMIFITFLITLAYLISGKLIIVLSVIMKNLLFNRSMWYFTDNTGWNLHDIYSGFY